MRVYHGTTTLASSIGTQGLRRGSFVTNSPTLATSYAARAMIRLGAPADSGLIAAADVDPADLAADPEAPSRQRASFILRRGIEPDRITFAPIRIPASRVAALRAELRGGASQKRAPSDTPRIAGRPRAG